MGVNRFILSVFFCLIVASVKSQDSDFIVTSNQDTIYGTFDFFQISSPGGEVSFSKEGEDNFKKYGADDLTGFNSKKFGPYFSSRTLKVTDRIFNANPLFLKVLLLGDQSLYRTFIKAIKDKVVEGEQRNGVVYVVVRNGEPSFLYSREGLNKAVAATDCKLRLKNYRYNDFEVASFYQEIADCNSLSSAIQVKGQVLDRKIRPFVEIGRFNYRWKSPSAQLRQVRKQLGNRSSVAIGLKKEVLEKLDVSLGIFYADYESTGSVFLEGRRYAILNRDSSMSTNIQETFLGPELSVDFRKNVGNNFAYISAGFRYGFLLSGRAVANLLGADSFCVRDTDGTLFDCRLNTITLDSEIIDDDRENFDPKSSVAPFACLGFQFLGKLKPYVEVRGNYGSFGRLNPSYLYDEVGINLGLTF